MLYRLRHQGRNLRDPGNKESACSQEPHETQVRSPGGEDPLEEETVAHSRILAWTIPWTEEPGGHSPRVTKSRTRLKRLGSSRKVSGRTVSARSPAPWALRAMRQRGQWQAHGAPRFRRLSKTHALYLGLLSLGLQTSRAPSTGDVPWHGPLERHPTPAGRGLASRWWSPLRAVLQGTAPHCALTPEREKEREVAQLCPTLCNPMGRSLPGSSVHGIFQTRILEWVAISFSRGSSRPRDRTLVSCIAGRRFTVWTTRESQSGSETCSVVSDSLRPHELYSPWNSLGQNTEVGILKWDPSPEDLPNPGIKSRSPALQADSLPAEPQGSPSDTWSQEQTQEILCWTSRSESEQDRQRPN